MPQPKLWEWEDKLQRYRSVETGRFIGAQQMVALRDRFIDAQKAQTADLAARLTSGEIDSATWVKEMRQVVKNTYIDQYTMAVGGRGKLTQADYGRIGAMCKEQYKYLQGFERDVLNGKMTGGQIVVRSGLYVESSTQAYERGRTEALGLPRLPQYPGDGATVCLSNCRCHWEIVPSEGGWLCYWRLGPVRTEHCPDCMRNAAAWAPLRVEAEQRSKRR